MRHTIAILITALGAGVGAQQAQGPVFRSGVDVMTVEASVLDDKGNAVADLAPDDFAVTVDGKPRRVRDVRFFHDGSGAAAKPVWGELPGPVRNSDANGRTVVFFVDRDSIAPGNEKAVFEAATTILDGLGPGDAAGVFELPGANTGLTRDHARVRKVLKEMTGSRPLTMMSRDYYLSWDEALGYERRDTQTIQRVVERECPDVKQPGAETGGTLRNPCPPELEQHAFELLATGRIRAQDVLSNLSSITRQLAYTRGPKQVVLLTSGFAFGQDLLPLFDRFTREAAESQVVFYAVHLESAGTDVTSRKTVMSPYAGTAFTTGVANLATMTGGAFVMTSGSGAGIFNRVRTEMNNFYELAVEMQKEDLTASSLEIVVKVARPGATVRNRRRVVPPARLAANNSADPLSDLIRQPIDVGQVPLALSAYSTRGDEASTLRTIIGLEAGSLINDGPAEWAFAVYSDGNLVATGRQKLEGGAGPWTAALSAKLLPGKYRLRAAVRDATGRAGVLERGLEVGLRGDARVQFSDLIVGVADNQGRLQPLSMVPKGSALSALVEVVSADPATLEQVRTVIELVPGGTATPIKRFVMGVRSGTSGAILTNQAEIATADLPIGRYTASATPMIGDRPLGRISRVFEIVE